MLLPHAAIIPQTALESPRNSENYLNVCVDARSGRFSIINNAVSQELPQIKREQQSPHAVAIPTMYLNRGHH